MTAQIIGANHRASWVIDPKHLGFVLARYKFVAKMLAGLDRVLEVGCGDATGTPIVAAAVGFVHAIDKDLGFVENRDTRGNIHFRHWDMITDPWGTVFDAAYALDVLEHIAPVDEDKFLGNIARSLRPHGTLIIGTPSLESQPHASPKSKAAHVNCKTEEGLRLSMRLFFNNVFIMGMNDETLHCGYGPMTHYRWAVCCGPRVP